MKAHANDISEAFSFTGLNTTGIVSFYIEPNAYYKMIDQNYTEHDVIAVNTINGDLFELVVKRNGLNFTPGDCVAIHTNIEKSRPYSIASAPESDEMRFIIRVMHGGEVSPWIMQRKPDDVIRITPPFGWFRPGQDIDDAPFVFIATGTGISPFLSYVHTFKKPPEQCLYGVRKGKDAIGFDAFKKICPTRLAVSREKTKHHHGRVTDLLDTLPLSPGTHYYCCGLESMINDATEWLTNNGISLIHIHREVFFHG